jgi:predicted nucleic acid-binding protein
MTYLLDISTLMALLWQTHVHNERVTDWQAEQKLAVCPLTELGFLRISTQPSFGLSVADARKVLRDWKKARKPQFVPCALEVLATDSPSTVAMTTDFYLASLAERHGMELATLDGGIKHKAAFVIPSPKD